MIFMSDIRFNSTLTSPSSFTHPKKYIRSDSFSRTNYARSIEGALMASEAKQAAYPKQSPIICQMTFSLFPSLFPLVLGIGLGGGSRPAGINSLKRYSFRFVFY